MAGMRPPLLNPLFANASGLKGIGDKLNKLLAHFLRGEQAEDTRLIDLLLHMPSGVVDRRSRPHIADLPQSGIVTIDITVGKHKPPPPFNKRLPYRVEVHDDTGSLTLIFFRAYADHLLRSLPSGERRFISGAVSWYGEQPQIAHPDYILSAEDFSRMPLIEPVYPLTAGLSPKVLGRAIQAALAKLPVLPEWQDAAFLAQRGWPAFAAALSELHRPADAGGMDLLSPARLRLAYDELLANQLALALVRRRLKRASGRRFAATGTISNTILARLPYQLTGAQRRAMDEISHDMAADSRMIRLLQGDVGAGKTVVALLALAQVVEAAAQGALMVPTEILARQHFATLAPLCAAAGLRLALLTGREKGSLREDVLTRLAAGEIDVLIGTHALFQEGVTFANLGLAVIDEQHRFGVHQRLALQAKAGAAVDLLVMTATPIPRTLALTVYGDMDVSKLDEKPPGRLPVETRVLPMSRLDDVVDGLQRGLAQGRRAYWVCPLVAESEVIDLSAAEDRCKALEAVFPGRVGLVHGKMKGSAKDAVMAAFKAGTIDILVATTVIEVGVDVPEASIMIIENAERFGLAQLHQLRGRVGRGAAHSTCLLLYQEPLGETAKARLSIMRETEDGFRIAEEDLKLRGSGEMLGTQQAGLPLFRIADLAAHGDLLQTARDDAALILARDPDLESVRGEALRALLYVFERDEAIKLLSSG
jgi:ATP-dependent DNA helicase RecG